MVRVRLGFKGTSANKNIAYKNDYQKIIVITN